MAFFHKLNWFYEIEIIFAQFSSLFLHFFYNLFTIHIVSRKASEPLLPEFYYTPVFYFAELKLQSV